ncbi:hypothetical protein L208DRAFT_1337880, partial [Tricholoma matsutake]
QTFACFLHQLSTLIGEIKLSGNYLAIKKIVTKSMHVVTFFNGSHYWGGQLKEEAKKHT